MEHLSEFVYLFTPIRENFLQTMTQEEMAAMGGHMEYTQRLFSEGKIVQAGACVDGAYGIVVFKAESEEAARQIYENDPVVKAKILNSELHPYRVTMLQKE